MPTQRQIVCPTYDFDGTEAGNFGARLQAIEPDVTNITSCRNAIDIEDTASAVFCCCCFLTSFAKKRKEDFYTVCLKAYNCNVFTNFQPTELHSFQNLILRLVLKIFLKFRKFQPRYSYKIYSFKKKSVLVIINKIIRPRVRHGRHEVILTVIKFQKDQTLKLLANMALKFLRVLTFCDFCGRIFPPSPKKSFCKKKKKTHSCKNFLHKNLLSTGKSIQNRNKTMKCYC